MRDASAAQAMISISNHRAGRRWICTLSSNDAFLCPPPPPPPRSCTNTARHLAGGRRRRLMPPLMRKRRPGVPSARTLPSPQRRAARQPSTGAGSQQGVCFINFVKRNARLQQPGASGGLDGVCSDEVLAPARAQQMASALAHGHEPHAILQDKSSHLPRPQRSRRPPT